MAEVRFSRLTLFERLLALVTSVRPGEGRSVFYLLVQVYLLLLLPAPAAARDAHSHLRRRSAPTPPAPSPWC